METLTKRQRDLEIVRRLVEVQKQAQCEAVNNYRNNPEIRAVVEKLKVVNGERKSA